MMQRYIVKNLAVSAEQIQEDFVLQDSQTTFNGQAGDYIIHENGKQRGCKKEDFESQYSELVSGKSEYEQFIEMMAQGYQEMGDINLELANESLLLENEVDLDLK